MKFVLCACILLFAGPLLHAKIVVRKTHEVFWNDRLTPELAGDGLNLELEMGDVFGIVCPTLQQSEVSLKLVDYQIHIIDVTKQEYDKCEIKVGPFVSDRMVMVCYGFLRTTRLGFENGTKMYNGNVWNYRPCTTHYFLGVRQGADYPITCGDGETTRMKITTSCGGVQHSSPSNDKLASKRRKRKNDKRVRVRYWYRRLKEAKRRRQPIGQRPVPRPFAEYQRAAAVKVDRMGVAGRRRMLDTRNAGEKAEV